MYVFPFVTFFSLNANIIADIAAIGEKRPSKGIRVAIIDDMAMIKDF